MGWGIVIYAIVYLVWSGLVIHGLAGSITARIGVLAALLAVVTLATRSLGYTEVRDVVPHAIGWVLIVGIMDAIFAVPYAGWSLYTDWNMWVGYLLVLFVPVIVTLVSKRHTAV